ncbi:MAG: hypothetical protein IPK42_13315 [Betaproteobacteria bacterium]|nr:hypothetical protein [Betaproteobacteria bacterium]
MRILTTAAQVRRVAGIDGPGEFPDYPYGEPIPREVGQALLDGISEVAWPADRDFLNDDGGWIVIFDDADDFGQRHFGLPAVTLMEDIRRIQCRDEAWWLCTILVNNETGVDILFRESVAPPDVLSSLMQQHEMLGAG